jgi:hypothetical protein
VSKLVINADTTPLKKSLLDVSAQVKKLGAGSTKVSIFSEQDRKFLKSELSKELSAMKTKLKDNKAEISKLVAEQKKLTRGTEEELAALREQAAAAAPVVVEEGEPSHDIDLTEAGIITNQTIFFAHTHREATMMAGMAILRMDRIVSAVNEYFYRVVKPYQPEDANRILMVLDDILVEPLSYDNAFTILGNAVKEAREEGGKDLEFWMEIDRRLTDTFMTELYAALSLPEGWAITSFIDDYKDLMDALSQQDSPDYLDIIGETAKTVLIRAMDLLTEPQQTDYINGLLDWGATIPANVIKRLLTHSEFCCTVEIPVTSEDLKPFLETGILPAEAVAFHRLLSNIVSNANAVQEDESPRVFLRLADQALFEVHSSKMVQDVYVLRPVQPASIH